MKKLFDTKRFLVVEFVLFSFLIVGFLMSSFGLFKGFFGYCSTCPPGAFCIMTSFVNYCSELYGQIIAVVSGVALSLYAVSLGIYKVVGNKKRV